MNISKIQISHSFKNNTQDKNKKEVIDFLTENVRNPRDVNDCVAVPRGIFKAYILIMTGFGLLGIAGALPNKMNKTKIGFVILGNILNIMSAIYFAKPFAIKGLNPTIKGGKVENK